MKYATKSSSRRARWMKLGAPALVLVNLRSSSVLGLSPWRDSTWKPGLGVVTWVTVLIELSKASSRLIESPSKQGFGLKPGRTLIATLPSLSIRPA